jgi:hypothetical protein
LNKTIEITVDAKGAVVVETKGFAGPSCKDASRFLEQALGEPTAERLTTEFHQSADQRVEQRQQQQ